jgi:hypothetical protein
MSQSHAEPAWLRGTFVTPMPCVHARCSPGCYPRGFARTGNARGGSLGRVQGHGADRREARAAMRGRERSVLCSFPGCGEILNEPGRCAEASARGLQRARPETGRLRLDALEADERADQTRATDLRAMRRPALCARASPPALALARPGVLRPRRARGALRSMPPHRDRPARRDGQAGSRKHGSGVCFEPEAAGRQTYSAPAASGGQPLGLTGRRPSSDPLERRAIAVPQRLHRCWIEARKAT